MFVYLAQSTQRIPTFHSNNQQATLDKEEINIPALYPRHPTPVTFSLAEGSFFDRGTSADQFTKSCSQSAGCQFDGHGQALCRRQEDLNSESMRDD